jgi:tetratricopeptide (TPR) repeat protein
MPHRSLSVRHLRGLRACLLAGLVFTLLLPRHASAADADKAAARAHYETGTRLFDVREYAEALKEFKAAYLAKPDPAFLFNIGQCNLKMGKNQEALDFFQQFLKKAPADDPNRGLVETRIRSIQAGLGTDSEPAESSGAAKPPAPPPASPPPNPPLWPVAQPAVAPVSSTPWPQPQPGFASSSPATFTQEAPASSGLDVNTKAQERPAAPAPTPFYKTWWFWTGIGVVVAGGAVASYFLLSRGGGTSVPDSTLGTRTLP